jgi:hypothetical protein
LTRRVVDAVWARVPLVPVIVSESAHGIALVVVFIVRVEEPAPLMEVGLKPPLVTPLGKPDSLPTLRLTEPVKPLTGVTVTALQSSISDSRWSRLAGHQGFSGTPVACGQESPALHPG